MLAVSVGLAVIPGTGTVVGRGVGTLEGLIVGAFDSGTGPNTGLMLGFEETVNVGVVVGEELGLSVGATVGDVVGSVDLISILRVQVSIKSDKRRSSLRSLSCSKYSPSKRMTL